MDKTNNILLVDDEPVVLASIKRIFKKDDYLVDAASSADEAIKLLDNNNYHLVISDIMMPGMNGLDLLSVIKEKKSSIKVIMITGYATMATAMKALRKGAYDFIAKPFTKEELRSVVIRAFREPADYARESDMFSPGDDKRIEPGKLFKMPNHSWAKICADGCVIIGADPNFINQVGKIVNIELPTVKDDIKQGEICAKVSAADGHIHSIGCPLSGRIIKNNEEILQDINLLLESPQNKGWLFKIDPTNIEFEVDNLELSE